MKNLQELVDALKPHRVNILMDVRSKPYSRNKAFNRGDALDDFLQKNGIAYWWMGEVLGGFGKILEVRIQMLADYHAHRENVICLMCMEADPDRCHRKTEIARRLEAYSISATHL
jgi:uncharacterized protein (DUF488 family)